MADEPLWTDNYDVSDGLYYRTHRDGRVAVFGREVDASRPNLWRASAWNKDPREHPDAKHTGLASDATAGELQDVLRAWAAATTDGQKTEEGVRNA